MSFLQSFFKVGSIASYLGRYVDHFAILGTVGLGYIVLIDYIRTEAGWSLGSFLPAILWYAY